MSHIHRNAAVEINNAAIILLEKGYHEIALQTFGDAIEVMLSAREQGLDDAAELNMTAKECLFRGMTRLTMSEVWPDGQHGSTRTFIRPLKLKINDETNQCCDPAEDAAVLLYNMTLIREFLGIYDGSSDSSLDRMLSICKCMERLIADSAAGMSQI